MPASSIVEDLEVLKDRVREFDASVPSLSVKKLHLEPAPERLDHGVVIAIADSAHRGQEAGVDRALREGPRGELRALVAVDHGLAVTHVSLLDGHSERVRHERGGRMTVNGPSDDPSTECVQHYSAVQPALPRRVLRVGVGAKESVNQTV